MSVLEFALCRCVCDLPAWVQYTASSSSAARGCVLNTALALLAGALQADEELQRAEQEKAKQSRKKKKKGSKKKSKKKKAQQKAAASVKDEL